MRTHTLRFPKAVDVQAFLADYWQQRPLLLPHSLPGLAPPLTPDELAGLACEEGVESRLVLEKDGVRPWEVRHGPFSEEDFTRLPETHWTLLVQDVDKHLPEAAMLLEPFRFIPDWRVDDVMISFAPAQGSVGPHVDDYDVFLVQAQGRRRWGIHTRTVDPEMYVSGLDLRILPSFEPDQEWVLEPGDVLYLPPNTAHWGVALEDCMTCSVGFRAPEWRELARSWMETLVEQCIPPGRYRDPPLRPQRESAEIRAEAIAQFEALLAELRRPQPHLLRPWLGRFLTEPKANLYAEPQAEHLDPDTFLARLEEASVLARSGYARMAYCVGEGGADHLFVNGVNYRLSSGNKGFLHAITQERCLHYGYLAEWLENRQCLELMCQLYNEGFFEFAAGSNASNNVNSP
jgi:50S ribosomal protein L16 3-hydroxylase